MVVVDVVVDDEANFCRSTNFRPLGFLTQSSLIELGAPEME
jgi:hypothetical protein